MNNENYGNHHDDYPNGTRPRYQYSWGALSIKKTLLILLVFLALYLPFINKAFHIDDYEYIHYSQRIGWNPLNAIPENICPAGQIVPNFLPYEITHPLLISYIIKVFIELFGEKEANLHLAFIAFPLIAIFSLVKLNGLLYRDTRQSSVLLAIFFFSTPAFLVNSQNLMTDVPTLAFILLAMVGFVSGLEKASPRMIYIGGGALTLAVFTSYNAIFFIPFILLYALWKRIFNIHLALSIIFPVMALLLWLIAIYYLYDIFPFIKSKTNEARSMITYIEKGLDLNALNFKIFSNLVFIGAGMIWVLPLHYALKKALLKFLLLLITLIIISYVTIFKLSGYSFTQNIYLSLFIALGLLTCVTLTQGVWRKKNGQDAKREFFLLLWFFTVIGYQILFPFSAARHLLPAYPPALMLLINDPAWSFITTSKRVVVSCFISGTLLFASASAYSDYKYAGIYRDYSAEVNTIRSKAGDTFNVWYIGAWGMRYYMERDGAKQLLASLNEPELGDLVVISEMGYLWTPSLAVQNRMVKITEQHYNSWFPLRLFNRKSHAGFYSSGWGMLPFAFSNEPDEVFTLYKIAQ